MRIPLLAALLACSVSFADEGMWTFDNIPVRKMKEKYGFEPSAQWLHKLQLGTLRFPGGTGAFVSRDGLVITNHHVGRSYIAQVSTAAADYIQHGFTAADRAKEVKIPGLDLKMLVSSENVTDKVNAQVKAGIDEKEALKARQNALSTILKENEASTGLVCEQVTLYQGGEYWIYRYKKFTDIRLVAAPEAQVASFGGDSDNYTYPRWNLDFALFRVYENDKPYKPDSYLPFGQETLQIGDLTIISGCPGATYRQQTLAEMVYARDTGIPYRLAFLDRQKKALEAFSATSQEARRIAYSDINSISNLQKRHTGQLMGLLKPENLAKVEVAESALRKAVDGDAALKAQVGDSWASIEKAVQKQSEMLKELTIIDSRDATKLKDSNDRDALSSRLLAKALLLVRMPVEEALPSEQRLADFSDGNLKARKTGITNPAPIEKDLDETRLAFGLHEARAVLGASHPFVKGLLGAKTPEEVAKAAMAGTRMQDLAYREQLLEGGKAAMDACQDPLVQLARQLDPFSREIRKRFDGEVAGILSEHGGRIARARFKVQGKENYPDATFSLRLSYGPVATYATGSGTYAQPFTTFLGLYDRHVGWGGNTRKNGHGAEPDAWVLPQRWVDRKDKLRLSTHFNFSYGCDTVGGNSGSPVVNRKCEFIGINFDSVLEGQGGYYVYDDATKRAVAVSASGILESLDKVMDGEHLVQEILGK